MKRKLHISLIVALAMLVLPQAASAACPVGIGNELSVVPPAELAEGDLQVHKFSVTACTTKQKVTVEWIKVKDSTQAWMGRYDGANRATIVPETAVTTDTSYNASTGIYTHTGGTTYTVPVGLPDGHYGVITRYYANGYVNAEKQGASSFAIKTPDVCLNIDGKQQTVPAGLVSDGNGGCYEDKCPNIGGIQQTVPAGYFVNSSGNCVEDKCPNVSGGQQDVPAGYYTDAGGNCQYDQCPNLSGGQPTVPAGYYTNAAGSCQPEMCPNLDGTQQSVPAGYYVDASGNCIQDKCPNLEGGQPTVPAGYYTDTSGNCQPDKCPNLDGIQQDVPAGYVVNASGNCLPPVVIVDPCPNLPGIEDAIPAGYTLVDGECRIVALPTGEDPKPLSPSPWITKVANRKIVKTGGNIVYTIRAGNRGPGTLKAARVCDRLPAGTVYVSHTGNASFANGSICWQPVDIARGKSVAYRLTLKVSGSFKGKRIVNMACVTSMNGGAKKCAKAVVKVTVKRKEAVGGVTG